MPFIAGGNTAINPSEYKRYIGIAPVKVLAINPSSKELEAIYGQAPETEPNYLGERTDSEGNLLKTARITFILKTDGSVLGPDNKPLDHIARMSFFLRKQYRKSRDGAKVQVIDRYGNHQGWPTVEQFKEHVYPLKSAAGKTLTVDTSYRPCIDGEDRLTDFLKDWLNIPPVERYRDGQWVRADDPSKCEARLDNLVKFFDGDFSELKSILAMHDADGIPVKNHTVKVLFGVRTGEDNKLYQEVYTSAFARGYSSSYSQIEKELRNDKEQGRNTSVEYEICPLREYKENVSTLSAIPDLAIPEAPKPVQAMTNQDLDEKAHKDDLPFSLEDEDMPDFGQLSL